MFTTWGSLIEEAWSHTKPRRLPVRYAVKRTGFPAHGISRVETDTLAARAAARALLAVLLVGMATGHAPVSAVGSSEAVGGSKYRLVAEWQLPESTLRWPQSVKGLALGAHQEEVYAVVGSPPAVWVLSPDGGVLRVVGEGVLQQPQGVAVAYPGQVVGSAPDPSTARLFVTDAAGGGVHVFGAGGQLIRTVSGLGEPAGIAGTGSGVVVTDPAHARLLLLDYEGGVQRIIDATSSDYALMRPYDVEAVVRHIVVADREAAALVWFDTDGRYLRDLPLIYRGRQIEPLDIALESPDLALPPDGGVLIAAETGLYRPLETAAGDGDTVQPVTADDVEHTIAVLASASSHWTCPALCGPMSVYGATASGEIRRWYTLGDERLYRACPLLGRATGQPVRAAYVGGARVLVGYDDGSLWLVDHEGTAERFGAIGAFDDIAASDGTYLTSRGGELRSIDGAPGSLALLAHRESPWAWPYHPDCPVVGHALAPSLGVSSQSGRADLAVVGWFKNLSNASVDLDATTMLKPYTQAADENGTTWSVQPWGWMFGDSYRPKGSPRLITDVESMKNGETVAVDRLAGRVYRFDPLVTTFAEIEGTGLIVPGRPTRVSAGDEGELFVLTAGGLVWELDNTGGIVSGWDAAGAVNGPRASLVDVAAGGGRVHLVDSEQRRLLVFEPVDGESDLPTVPRRCTLTPDKNASADTVPLGKAITVTLSVGGDCGRKSVASDILFLLEPPPPGGGWQQEATRRIVDHFLDIVDWQNDRVAVMLFDGTPDLIAGFGQSKGDIEDALGQIRPKEGLSFDAQPLEAAAAYFGAHARPRAEMVLINVAASPYVPIPITTWARSMTFKQAAEILRDADVRSIVITNSILGAYIGATVASEPEDFYVAPDGATIAAIYEQLAVEYTARWLARDMVVADVIPENMSYVVGSAQPPAKWDERRRTLAWSDVEVGYGGWRAEYNVVPTSLGHWPTNEVAEAEFIDGFGNPGQLTFPLPWVRVITPPTATPTPSASVTPMPTKSSVSSPTPTPTRVPQPAYLPLALNEHCDQTLVRADIALAIDTSSSMTGEKLADAKDGAISFVRLMDLAPGRDQVAVVRFDADAELLAELSGDRAAVERSIRGLETRRGTRIDLGLQEALAELESHRRIAGNTPVIVLLTDGIQTGGSGAELETAREARDAGVRLYTIGLGDDAHEPMLIEMASNRSCYYFAPNSSHLRKIYGEVARDIECPAEQFWGKR